MTNLKNRSIAATAALIATLATVGASTPAPAATGAEAAEQVSVSRTVGYADLDLSTADGQAVMARRIRLAAIAVCGESDLANRQLVMACRGRAVAGANARLADVRTTGGAIQIATAR